MNTLRLLKTNLGLAAIGLLAIIGQTATGADNLGTVITETGWDKIIGTWVDPETKGEQNRSTFAWKYEGVLMESTTKLPTKETTSLFGRNLKTGKIFVVSAESGGGCSTGEVVFTKGLATFTISYCTEDGDAGDVEIRYTLVDDDHIDLTFVMGQPVTIKLVRESK